MTFDPVPQQQQQHQLLNTADVSQLFDDPDVLAADRQPALPAKIHAISKRAKQQQQHKQQRQSAKPQQQSPKQSSPKALQTETFTCCIQ